jgi:hypothetical protein
MLRTLRITNFRGLREFAMSGLGRVNLLVGTNNCGKTSVLEAIHMLSAPGSAAPLWLAQLRRGELVNSTTEAQIDVAHLVHGHKLAEGRGFQIAGDGTTGRQELAVSFVTRDLKQKDIEDIGEDGDSSIASAPGMAAPMSLQLDWRGDSPQHELRLPITRLGRLRDRVYRTHYLSRGSPGSEMQGTVVFITTGGQTQESIISMFESVVLTPDEATLLQALHAIEPGIERIASIGTRGRISARDVRGGLAVMVAGQRIPIGSMGDGIWRLLGVALALVQARGGVLLVDEIDTGLHYSVLVDMWRLVFETARSLDVQVFATTHSRDCYEALAAVTEPDRSEISLQRIERGKVEAIAFTELEIRQAAERGLEVR